MSFAPQLGALLISDREQIYGALAPVRFRVGAAMLGTNCGGYFSLGGTKHLLPTFLPLTPGSLSAMHRTNSSAKTPYKLKVNFPLYEMSTSSLCAPSSYR